jgi:hypothetical protein
MRWEVTRRHPSYLVFWNAQPPKSLEGPEDLKKTLIENLASIKQVALGAIGVSEKTIDPAIEFNDLGDVGIEAEWLSGVVHPVSMRGLASLLVSNLPKDSLQKIGMAILEAGLDDELGKEPRKIQSLAKIASYDHPDLNSFPLKSIVSINPNASGRKVQPEIASLLKKWKKEHQLPEKRDRSNSEQSCIEVWDLREGWRNGVYSPSLELRFQEIATKLEIPLTTAHARYKRAFEMVSGHTYSVSNWFALVGPIKTSRYVNAKALGGLSRNLVEKTTRDVPSSRLGRIQDSDNGFIELNSIAAREDHSVWDSLNDLEELFSAGKNNAQICTALNVKPTKECLQALDALRERLQDGALDE